MVKNAEVSEKTGPEAVERLEKVERELCFQQLRRFQQFLPKFKLGLFVLQTLSTQGAVEFSTLWGLLGKHVPCAKIVCCYWGETKPVLVGIVENRRNC